MFRTEPSFSSPKVPSLTTVTALRSRRLSRVSSAVDTPAVSAPARHTTPEWRPQDAGRGTLAEVRTSISLTYALRIASQTTVVSGLRLLGAGALASVPSAHAVGITRWDAPTPTVVSLGEPWGAAAETLQRDCDGPGAATIHPTQLYALIDDVRKDDRWPAFAAGVGARTPIRSILCCQFGRFGLTPSGGEGPAGCISLYSTQPHAYSYDDTRTLQLLVAHAGIALDLLHARAENAHRAHGGGHRGCGEVVDAGQPHR